MTWKFWQRTSTAVPKPSIAMAADGFFYLDGKRLCEDCWQPIPLYVDFPLGLTSPESDGTPGMNYADAKRRQTAVEGKDGIEALRKAVCLPCYQAAFRRMYPHSNPSALRTDVIPPAVKFTPEPEAPMVHIPEPRA